jgi:hypothetical protein
VVDEHRDANAAPPVQVARQLHELALRATAREAVGVVDEVNRGLRAGCSPS